MSAKPKPTPHNPDNVTPAQLNPRRMDPNRFVIGQRVHYGNHVARYEIAMLEVVDVTPDRITASRILSRNDVFSFTPEGVAMWSPNLSISADGQPFYRTRLTRAELAKLK